MAESDKNKPEDILEGAVQRFVDAQLRGQMPDIDEYVHQCPGLESQLRQRIHNLKRIGVLFTRLTQAQAEDFGDTAEGGSLTGQKLGNFDVIREIGRGGMGRVYLAQDSKLERSVAIKGIPPELARDAQARARFQREARLLASLSHPNIAVIHELIEQDPDSSFLVLEYIPGQTLTERIAHKPLELEEVLTIGRQIAEALQGAYEQGVIHRDLKPGNVKITPEGLVKVLDFGLAKASSPHKSSTDISITQPGRIVGTPAYMSPEQARGHSIDHRTDIWSFGCVIYEMLTGQLPFEGGTATDTVARILEREPDWRVLPKKTPANIRVMLRRCLEKNPQQRLQHIGDAVIEINETLNVPATAAPLTGAEAGYSRSALQRLGVVCALVGLILGAIVVGIALRISTPRSSSEQVLPPGQRTLIKLPENQTLALSRTTPLGYAQPAIALSPDGSSLVYVADIGETTQLFVRLMNEFQARPIPGTEGAFCPFFSPDGRWVGFFTNDKLKKVSLLGGEPVPLCDATNPEGASWGGDDTICFAEYQGETLTQVSAAGGIAAPMAGVERSVAGSYSEPQILPGGNWVLFSGNGDIAVVSPKTGEKRILIKNGYYARYLPTGHLVYAQARMLVAVPFDLAALKEVAVDSVPVLEKVLLDSTSGSVQYTFSGNGLLVYVPGDDAARSVPVFVDRRNNTEPLPMPAQIYGKPGLSPDGKKLAIVVRAGYKRDVYIYDVATGRSSRLTLDGDNDWPIWTADGKRIVFVRRTQGQEKRALFWKPVDGSEEPELLYSSEYYLSPGSWSPNGKVLAFFERRQATGGDILTLTVEGKREPELIVGTEATEWAPAFSPDGRYIAYTSDRDGKFQVYVRPYPDNDWVRQISDDFGEEPIWSPSGDELFYRNGDTWMVVSISTEPEFTPGTPQELFKGLFNNVPGISYDVAPDGRFLVLQPEFDDSNVRELHVVLNWFDEVKRKVPKE
jgi:serine/threonine-protein kinase